jgi:hypothetical protein
MTIRRLALAGALAAAVAAPAAAHAAPGFSGSSQFSGPITPGRPITLIPVLGAHFSYSGSGTCSDGEPISVSFTNGSTLFDTCELGPDFGLHGLATIGTQQHHVTVNLARVAVAGPFVLTTRHHGLALGIAQFSTANPADCLTPGVTAATLSANFQTLRPLH